MNKEFLDCNSTAHQSILIFLVFTQQHKTVHQVKQSNASACKPSPELSFLVHNIIVTRLLLLQEIRVKKVNFSGSRHTVIWQGKS